MSLQMLLTFPPVKLDRVLGDISYFFTSDNIGDTPKPDDPAPPFNSPVHINSLILPAVMSSAAEAELGAIFYNAKDACALRNTLQDLGHPQRATIIQVGSACAVGLANDMMMT
jgi:hypothetical protein